MPAHISISDSDERARCSISRRVDAIGTTMGAPVALDAQGTGGVPRAAAARGGPAARAAHAQRGSDRHARAPPQLEQPALLLGHAGHSA